MSPRTVLAALAAAAALAAPAVGQDAPGDRPAVADVPALVSARGWDSTGWTKLGTVTLSGSRTNELIGLRGGAYDQLMLYVDGDLELSAITVVLSGGDRVVRGVKHRFWASGRTRQIELPGNKRTLRSLSVLYEMPAGTQAKLEIFGRKSSTIAPATTAVAGRTEQAPGFVTTAAAEPPTSAPAISERQGWTLLGAQTVDVKRDADTIRVPQGAAGMFDQIAIVATGGDLELSDLKLRFAGGQTAEVETRYYLRGDERTKVITLPGAGDGRVLRVIQLRYGSERGGGKTRVAVWAR